MLEGVGQLLTHEQDLPDVGQIAPQGNPLAEPVRIAGGQLLPYECVGHTTYVSTPHAPVASDRGCAGAACLAWSGGVRGPDLPCGRSLKAGVSTIRLSLPLHGALASTPSRVASKVVRAAQGLVTLWSFSASVGSPTFRAGSPRHRHTTGVGRRARSF